MFDTNWFGMLVSSQKSLKSNYSIYKEKHGKDGLTKSVKVLKRVGCLKYSELNKKSIQQVLFQPIWEEKP